MELQTTFTIFLLIATLIVMSTQRLRPDITALMVMLLIVLSGILTPAEALSAFGQPVIIIVASVFVIGAALFETGVAIIIANQILRFRGQGETVLLLVIMLITGTMASVLGGLLSVALVMPAVLRVAREAKIAPARLLLPLATVATMGSFLTLIGSASNLLVSDILVSNGLEPLRLFTLTPYALASVGIVMVWYLFVGRRFLGKEPPAEVQAPSLEEVQQSYGFEDVLYRLRVRSTSNLIATYLVDSQLQESFGLNLVAVQPNAGKSRPASAEWVLEQDDVLIVAGDRGRVLQAANRHDMELKEAVGLDEFNRLDLEKLRLAEVIVPVRSRLVGNCLAELNFRDHYGLNVLAIHRQGQVFREGLARRVLEAGDTLLVQGPLERIRSVGQDLSLVFMTDLGPRPGDLISGKAGLTLLILGAFLAAVLSGFLSLAVAGLVAALALILTNCISIERAYQSIDASLLVMIGGMLPLATAMETTGAANIIAEIMITFSEATGPLGSLLILQLLIMVITQVIDNTVVAALMTPIAINLAVAQGLPPLPFAIIVAFAAGAGYVTPLTDGDNILVREPGQYTMRDYVVNGLPIFIIQALVLLGMVAFGYPLV